MTEPTILIAFSAGLGSFIAPCILPMIPAFLAYISGTTLTEIKNDQKSNFQINKINIVINTIFFVPLKLTSSAFSLLLLTKFVGTKAAK